MSRAAAHQSRTPSATNTSSGSVLIVTDDHALIRLCTAVLEPAGYDVTSASHSGHALLQCMSGHRADILLTDLLMPDGSGPALAERLRRYYPAMHAIYFASAGTLINEGNVLVRPFSKDDLLARVRK